MASNQPDYSGSAMIALYPPPGVVNYLQVPNGLEPAELHCTVAYLGDAADVDLDAVLAAAAVLARRSPITGAVSGHARFTGGEQDVVVALVDSPDLEQLRRDVVDALRLASITIPREHGYTAHITQQYLEAHAPSPVKRIDAAPVAFDTLSVVHGDRRIDIPFATPITESIAPHAREAFAAGWAASGGPLTERVRAASQAAVRMACEHHDDPNILEVTLKLGALEGTWAAVFERRDQLHASYLDDITDAWRKLADKDEIRAAVLRFRRDIGLTETSEDDDHRKAVALLAARRLLQQLASVLDHEDYSRLVEVFAEALADAEAEGSAAGLAIAANQTGVTGLDLELAADDFRVDLVRYRSDAKALLADILDSTATDLGGVLAKLAAEEAGLGDMLAAVAEVLDPDAALAIRVLTDHAIGVSYGRGMLALYGRIGVSEVDFITAGGAKVCRVCAGYEAENPWLVQDVPRPAIHPHCRCMLAPSEPPRSLDVSRYLPVGVG